jgi:hypothetical protein
VFFIWPRSRLRVTSKVEEGAKPAVLVSSTILGWRQAFRKARACWSLVPAFTIASMILDVARDLAFRETSDDRCPPCLLKSEAWLFNFEDSTVEKSSSTTVVEFSELLGPGLVVSTSLRFSTFEDFSSIRGGRCVNSVDDGPPMILVFLAGRLLPSLLLLEGGISRLCGVRFWRPVPRFCCRPAPVARGIVVFFVFHLKKVFNFSPVLFFEAIRQNKWRALTVPISGQVYIVRRPYGYGYTGIFHTCVTIP